jgi:hypothetical protein
LSALPNRWMNVAAPVCVDLKTYPVKVENNEIFIEL